MVMMGKIFSRCPNFSVTRARHIRRLQQNRPCPGSLDRSMARASVVIQDAAAYQKLLEELEDARTRESLRQADRGEVLPGKEAFALLRKRALEPPQKMIYRVDLTARALADMEAVHEKIAAKIPLAGRRPYLQPSRKIVRIPCPISLSPSPGT